MEREESDFGALHGGEPTGNVLYRQLGYEGLQTDEHDVGL